MTAMLATVSADNLVAMFVFWEATSFLSFLLVGFQSEDEKARKAALQSLLVTAGGGLALLAGIILIGVRRPGPSRSRRSPRTPRPCSTAPLFPAIVACVLIGALHQVRRSSPSTSGCPTP